MIVTAKASPAARVTVPVTVGVVSLVINATTVGTAGAVRSIISSLVVTSLVVFPAASVTVAVTG